MNWKLIWLNRQQLNHNSNPIYVAVTCPSHRGITCHSAAKLNGCNNQMSKLAGTTSAASASTLPHISCYWVTEYCCPLPSFINDPVVLGSTAPKCLLSRSTGTCYCQYCSSFSMQKMSANTHAVCQNRYLTGQQQIMKNINEFDTRPLTKFEYILQLQTKQKTMHSTGWRLKHHKMKCRVHVQLLVSVEQHMHEK